MTEVLYTDEREPTPEVPLFYFERAYLVEGTDEAAAAEMLRDRLPELADSVVHRPHGRFVRLAAFDHRFQDVPERDPVAVITWRDWADEPFVTRAPISSDPGRFSVPPALGELPVDEYETAGAGDAPSSRGGVPRPATNGVGSSTITMMAVPGTAGALVATTEPAESAEPTTQAKGKNKTKTSRKAKAKAKAEARAKAKGTPDSASEPTNQAPIPAKTKAEPETEARAEPVVQSKRVADKTDPQQAPVASKSDLIGDLFERLHELHFQGDMLEGADFVLGVLAEVFPCAGALLHVFDIDQREFVVVRAVGPDAASMLMRKTAGGDPFFHALMKRHRSLALNPVPEPQDKLRERWEELGVEPTSVLCVSSHTEVTLYSASKRKVRP